MKQTFRLQGKELAVEENLVDRVIRYFDPARANSRFRARGLAAASTAWEGASRSDRALKGWSKTRGDADSDTLLDLDELRANSSDLIRNSPLGTGAIGTVVTSVVGPGFTMQSRIDRDILAHMDDETADRWEAQTEREWRLFAGSCECDLERRLNFDQLLDLILRSQLEKGDVFVLMPSIRRPGSPYRLKLQLIEAERVSNPHRKTDSATIAGGIERDEFGAVVRYHIQDQHPGNLLRGGRTTWQEVQAFGDKTGRRNILHAFRPLRPGQTRGVPYLAPVIRLVKQLTRYIGAEVDATVIASFFTIFIESESQLGAMTPTSETGAVSGDDEVRLGPAAVVGLAPGEKATTANPGRPNQAFDGFVVALTRLMGSALEIPYEVLVKHFTASFSASQAALLEAWRFFKARRKTLVSTICNPIYEVWMTEAVASGRITAPGFFSDPIMRQAYLKNEWVGAPQGQINELIGVKAARERRDAGFTTTAFETAQMTGGDWETNHKQSVKENNARVRDGLVEGVFVDPLDPVLMDMREENE